jgi:phage baseplate assembly protein W|tara:strand:+ start:1061 stop:1573 length:513 start_codon:yes stop_codon:yes gene_type:complete
MSTLEKDLDPNVFIGVSLPLGHGNEGFFAKTKTTLDQARHNIRNLLLTIKGERLGNPTFGSNLYRVLFEPDDGNIASSIEEAIREAMGEWLPYINIKSIDVTTSGELQNAVNVRIDFTINVDQKVAQLDLNLKKGDLGAGDGVGADTVLNEDTGEYESVDDFEVNPFYDF